MITLIGNPILRKKVKRVSSLDPQLVKKMFFEIRKVNGVGLAAPQIGKSIALAVIANGLGGMFKHSGLSRAGAPRKLGPSAIYG